VESIRVAKYNAHISLLRRVILWDILVHHQLEHGSAAVCAGGSARELAGMGGIDRVRGDMEPRHRELKRDIG